MGCMAETEDVSPALMLCRNSTARRKIATQMASKRAWPSTPASRGLLDRSIAAKRCSPRAHRKGRMVKTACSNTGANHPAMLADVQLINKVCLTCYACLHKGPLLTFCGGMELRGRARAAHQEGVCTDHQAEGQHALQLIRHVQESIVSAGAQGLPSCCAMCKCCDGAVAERLTLSVAQSGPRWSPGWERRCGD